MDCFFFDGAKIAFQVALTILEYNEEAILKCKDEGEAMQLLNDYLAGIYLIEEDYAIDFAEDLGSSPNACSSIPDGTPSGPKCRMQVKN